jgi:ectoine hydroxylase-related dioxygenase (phytanoyl-CoA dioxygenase family)
MYRKLGYLPGEKGVSTEDCIELERELVSLLQNPPDLPDPWMLKTHLLLPSVYQAATQKPVLDQVASVLGNDLFLLSVDVFIKPPHSDKIVNWHQDGNYWGFDPFDITTAWIAVTEATLANGCMQFAPKTHLDRLQHTETYAENSALSRGQEIGMDMIKGDIISNELQRGQFSLHHCLLAHYSGPNTTDSPRIGLAARFMPTSIRQLNTPGSSVILVRGEDHSCAFPYDRKPDGALTSSAKASHAAALKPHRITNYSTV